MPTTLTLTGATDLTVVGLVEGPPGVFHLPDVSSSQMAFAAPAADPVSTTVAHQYLPVDNITIIGAPGANGANGANGGSDPHITLPTFNGGSLVDVLASVRGALVGATWS